MIRTALTTAAIFLIVASAPLGAAEIIYKWVDDKGTVHYGERPPQGVDAEPVLVTAAPNRDPANAPYASASDADDDAPNAAQQQREERAARLEERRQEEAKIAAACTAQRARLEELVPHSRVILQNPDGTSRMLDDEERLSMIEEARAFVDEHCPEP